MAEKKAKAVKKTISLPEGVKVVVTEATVNVEGPKGKVSKTMIDPSITVDVTGDSVTINTGKKPAKNERTKIGTINAHIKNMIIGVTEGHKYTLKICSGHFPMNVSVNNNQVIVKNFLGEKFPRIAEIIPGAQVKIDGVLITVESIDKEVAGQTAASIDQMCRITNRDRRIFQDGIYIIDKCGKEIK